MNQIDPTIRIESAAAWIRSQADISPQVAIVTGSGLSSITQIIKPYFQCSYQQIPGDLETSVSGHHGFCMLGYIGTIPVIVFCGRIHLYEGHTPDDVVFHIRLASALGAKIVLLTNAAGGIAKELVSGSFMVLTDHINLTGQTPLLGTIGRTLGPRFFDMTYAYDQELRTLFLNCAQKQNIKIHQGIYAGLLGPSYETPAEIRMLQILGADAVGMSTVLETIAARHLNMRVLAISLISNQAAGISGEILKHADVEQVAESNIKKLLPCISQFIELTFS